MVDKVYEVEIRETFNKKYLKVFLLDDTIAKKLEPLVDSLKEVKNVNITQSQSKAHSGDTLTVYPKPMVSIELLKEIVEKTLDCYFSGVTEKHTDVMTTVSFNANEKKILDALDKALATIDVSVAWFTNPTLQQKLLEKKENGCKIRVMIDANYTNQKYGVDLTPFEYKAVKAERNGIMHYKFCVIDNNTVVHGSYNWTTNAETRNNEEVSVTANDVKMASQYTKEFNRFWDSNS